MTEKEKELLLSCVVNEQFRIDQEFVELRQRLLQILSSFSYSSSVEQILRSFHGSFFGFFVLIVWRFFMDDLKKCNGSGDCSNCVFDDCVFNAYWDDHPDEYFEQLDDLELYYQDSY